MAGYSRRYFGIIDYSIFGCTLALSGAIGIYNAIKHRKNLSSAEYLLASQTMPWFPIFLSMVASFFSAVGVMGFPAQIYATGITFVLHIFAFFIPICLCAEIMTPLFRKLKLVSVNEYLELRFSRGIRYLGCLLFYLQYLTYLSIVLYAPSLALFSVAEVPLYVTIISTGVICTFYTALGGMRAVIWTDVFQSFIMTAGLITIVAVGIHEVGSLKEVFDISYRMGRLNVSFSPDPKVYHTFWGITIGLTFPMLPVWSISQPTIQRVISAKSDKEARRALYASFAALVITVVLLMLVALVIFACYAECDLLCSKQISQNDQILPYFIMNKVGHLTGIPGLFTACIYSFALSTISSGLNAMSALFLEDVAKKFKPDISDVWCLRVSKLTACAAGMLITGLAFVVPYLGKYVIKLAIQFFGIIGGPYFAIFALGIFTERANYMGAYIGSFTGLAVGLLLSIGQLIYPPNLNLPPVSIERCEEFNITIAIDPEVSCRQNHVHSNPIAALFSISYVWHGMIAILMSVTIGYVASLCSSQNSPDYLQKNLIYDYNENFLVKKICYKNNQKYKVSEKGNQRLLMLKNLENTEI